MTTDNTQYRITCRLSNGKISKILWARDMTSDEYAQFLVTGDDLKAKLSALRKSD